LYFAYEEQAKELNRITVRINKIISALKVRGFYDSTLEGIEKVLSAEDNTLIPAENVAAMQQGQTLDKAIWLMPLQELITVLQQLYVQRQQIKQVIYEITGISDILRGASQASETATAQNIKNQWGTLRLKRMQKLVMRFVRDSLRIMGEIAMTKLSQETIAGMTGLQYPTAEQKQQAQAQLQQLQMQAQYTQQPPNPQQVQPLMSTAKAFSWEEILGLLQDDLQRSYNIDIETNSTVDAEATEDKANMGEFLNAVAQFLNGVGPMVQQGILPFDAAKSILLAVTRRYRFGTDVEDQIAQMQAPKPPEDPKAGQAKAKMQQDAQAAQAEAQLQAQKSQLEMAQAQQDAQNKTEIMKLEYQLKQAETQLKVQELRQKEELTTLQHQGKLQQLAQQALQRRQQAAMPPKSTGVTAA